ncbi:MAG: DUF92 domain-containing protein [Chloroflexota bacterium]|nr:MAG: DUF92 domain-containing protein [Chloroflexota bacterium]
MWILIGFGLGILVAYAAFRLHALNVSGAVSAAVIGGLIFGFGGLPWATLLLIFFISSSLLSRVSGQKKKVLYEKFAKDSRRDYGQVLANGGLGAVLALVYWFFPENMDLWIAFAGCMAAVNADTWGTELGVLSPVAPRLITNGRVVPNGTSGGITLAGYLASAAGAVLIGFVSAVFMPAYPAGVILFVVVLGGLAGATVDSLLGATVQGIYYCPKCKKETESAPEHHCGTETEHLRGWRWLNNDLVNLVCSIVGASIAVGGWLLFG